MRIEQGGRLTAEREDTIRLLEERREQLQRLEAYLRELNPTERERCRRQLNTARWSVKIIEERLREEGTHEQEIQRDFPQQQAGASG